MTIRWIGQSGYILKTESTEIIIDPYLSDAVNRIANRPRMVKAPIEPEKIEADAVICTYDHIDHLDTDAIALMNPRLRFITTEKGKEILNSMGRENVTVLKPGESTKAGNFNITAVFAKHTTEAFGIIAGCNGKNLYFSGDTLFDERLFEISHFKPDITFICINGKLGNMNVNEAILTAEKIGAAVNIPNHYGMFASNTEDPGLFSGRIRGGRTLEYNRSYKLEEIESSHLTDSF